MSLTSALVIFAQSAAPVAAEAPRPRSRPAVERVRARAEILQPTLIRISDLAGSDGEQRDPARNVQRRRDEQGTVWIEFS